MSAFARRKLLLEQEKTTTTSTDENHAQSSNSAKQDVTKSAPNGGRSARSRLQRKAIAESTDGDTAPNSGYNTDNEICDSTSASIEKSDVEMQEASTNVQISTFVPNEQNFIRVDATEHAPSKLIVRMQYKETLVLQGEYRIEVTLGSISINGAFITAPDSLQVFAPSTHSLPYIECQKKSKKRRSDGSKDDLFDAALVIHDSFSGLQNLEGICPIFNGIWQPSRVKNTNTDSFTPIFQSYNPVPVVTIPQSWHKAFKNVQNVIEVDERNGSDPTIIMAVGAKSAGKSTLTRFLLNQLLTKKSFKSSVAFLELDPGQPTFTAPGILALHVIYSPVVGPPFTCIKTSPSEAVRMHHIGYTSPREDPEYYISSISDLIKYYRTNIAPSHIPLIINTPGWIKGTGRELLQEIVDITKVTDIVALGPPGECSNLLDELLSSDDSTRRYIVEASPVSSVTGPKYTPADLRTLQTICYFHLHPPESATYCDFSKHLTSQSPWLATYHPAENAAISVVSIMNSDVSQSLLMTALIATVVSIELVPRSILNPMMFSIFKEMATCSKDVLEAQTHNMDNNMISEYPSSIYSLSPLPSLLLSETRTAGLAIMRDIDITNHEFQLLTPIPMEAMESWERDDLAVVLVRGRLEMPVWLLWNGEVEQRWDKNGASFQTQTPYLNFAGTMGDAAKGAKEWRVRRNLMRRGQVGNG